MNIKVKQINCNHLRIVHTSLELAAPLDELFLTFLQEPYLHNRNPCGLTKSFLHYTPDVNCRAAIYASPGIGLTFHPNLSSRDCTTCSAKLDGETVFFSSVYLDCRKTVEEPAWLCTISKATSAHKHYLAGIDTNAHSVAWGSPSTDLRGSKVEEILFHYGMCILNEGNSPTFETARAATCIDITVASPVLASLMTDWTVQPEMHHSDHHLLTVNLPVTPDRMPLRKGRHLRKADWKAFTRLVNTAYEAYSSPVLWSVQEID
jgi:hypothetical protein